MIMYELDSRDMEACSYAKKMNFETTKKIGKLKKYF